MSPVRRLSQPGLRTGAGARLPVVGVAQDVPAGAGPDENVDQDDGGLADSAAPHPRSGEPHLVLSPVAQPPSRPHPAHHVTHHQSHGGRRCRSVGALLVRLVAAGLVCCWFVERWGGWLGWGCEGV
jgi:hypothetical protein